MTESKIESKKSVVECAKIDYENKNSIMYDAIEDKMMKEKHKLTCGYIPISISERETYEMYVRLNRSKSMAVAMGNEKLAIEIQHVIDIFVAGIPDDIWGRWYRAGYTVYGY